MAPLNIRGRPAAPGFASGPLQVLTLARQGKRVVGDPDEEARALRQAIVAAVAELSDLASRLSGEAADMVGFQVAMLEDPTLAGQALEAVAGGTPAETAWTDTMEAEIAGYRLSDDEYFRARAGDLADIRDRVLAALTGVATPRIGPGAIVFAADLTPSLFLSADWRDGGIALAEGSPTSHVAMLARSRGVPMVVGLDGAGAAIKSGASALLDGADGRLVIGPDAGTRAEFERRHAMAVAEQDAWRTALAQPARTADGTRIHVLLNVADPAELDGFDPAICDGIGLVRTELLFEGAAPPDEEAQLAVYRRILRWAGGRPVTIRTLDAGGDKPIAGITPEGEKNPFLGVRGIRVSLRHPALFKTQLRALARAAAEGPVAIMIPMVAFPSEIQATRCLLDEACTELAARAVAYAQPPLGIMVEVPAVAVAPEFYDADFYSIGSNDLVQYTLAAGRDVAALADQASAADPAVLRLIANVVDHGRRTDRKVSLCGDAGGDTRLVPALLDAGLRTLSMAPSDVGAAKRAIAAHSFRTLP